MTEGDDLDFDAVDFEDLQLLDNVLGHGAFGVVREGRLGFTPVAVKFLKEEKQVLSQLRQEVDFLKKVHHPNVLLFRGVCLSPPSIITEVCELGSVGDVIDLYNQIRARSADASVPLFAIAREKQETIEKAMSWPGRVKLALDAAKGMFYLHSKKLLHCDLKSGNLLVDSSRTCKVADFGLSRKITGKQTEINAPCPNNPTWLAPEVAADPRNCSKAGDVYSFAIVMWELLMLQKPSPCYFAHPTERPPLPDDLKHPPGCVAGSCAATQMPGVEVYIELMKSAWAEQPDQRPDFEQVAFVLERIQSKIKGEAWHPGLPEHPLHYFLTLMKNAGVREAEPSPPCSSVHERLQRNADAALQNPLMEEAMKALEKDSLSGQPPISLQDWINVGGASKSAGLPPPSAEAPPLGIPDQSSTVDFDSPGLSGILHAPSLPENFAAQHLQGTSGTNDAAAAHASCGTHATPPGYSELNLSSEASGSFQSTSYRHHSPEHSERASHQPKPAPSSAPTAVWSPFESLAHRRSLCSAEHAPTAHGASSKHSARTSGGASLASPFECHYAGTRPNNSPGNSACRADEDNAQPGTPSAALDLASRVDPNLLAAAKMIGSGGFERTLKFGTDSFSFPTTTSMTTSSGFPSEDYGSRNGTRGSSAVSMQMRTREASPSHATATAPSIASPFAAGPSLRHVRSADAKPPLSSSCALDAPSFRTGRM